jgi:hypothetical protein
MGFPHAYDFGNKLIQIRAGRKEKLYPGMVFHGFQDFRHGPAARGMES